MLSSHLYRVGYAMKSSMVYKTQRIIKLYWVPKSKTCYPAHTKGAAHKFNTFNTHTHTSSIINFKINQYPLEPIKGLGCFSLLYPPVFHHHATCCLGDYPSHGRKNLEANSQCNARRMPKFINRRKLMTATISPGQDRKVGKKDN